MSIIHASGLDEPVAIECAQAGCRDCLNGLMQRHERLVHTVLRRQSSGPLSYTESLQAGRIGLWRAVLRFDPSRGVAFSTYAGVAIKRRIWRAVKQAQRPQGWLASESPPDPRALAEEKLWWGEVKAALAAAIGRLPGRQREVMLARCGWDGEPPRNFTQIGQEWGVSHQAAEYWYHKALVSLRLPAVSGSLRQLWGQGSREDYARSQALSRAWLRQRRGRRINDFSWPQRADKASFEFA
jgi:RNA polymerase sigma factor (sigma-70 family)